MEHRYLGNSGTPVSVLGLGTMTFGTSAWRPWMLDEPESRSLLQPAREHGITFFNTATYARAG